MHPILSKIALGTLALLTLTGASQAQDVSFTVRHERAYQPVEFRDDCRDRRYIRAPDQNDKCWRRYSGRPHWGGYDRCRVIVTRRVNAWGDVVVRRINTCR